MIEYRQYATYWVVTCDRCGKLEHIGTVREEQRARDIVERWAWNLDTPNGDLCPRCDRVRSLGMLDRPPEPDLPQSLLPGLGGGNDAFWSKVLSIDNGESAIDNGQPCCEQCGKTLSWTVTPGGSGQYLCDDCQSGKVQGC